MDVRDSKTEASPVLSSSSNSNGSSAATLLAGAATMAMIGVKLAQKEYKEYKEAKHLEGIKQIVDLHRRYLVGIDVPGVQERPSLPAPFILDVQNNLKSARALILNESMQEDLVEDSTVSSDKFLLKYCQYIKNAKQCILNFYTARLTTGRGRNVFTRGKEDDVTSSVLTYLLVIISQHCTKFEGYEMDMAILSGIIRFIRGFISIPGKNMFGQSEAPKKRQRFEMLMPAVRNLRKAKRVLREHSNSNYMKTHVDELMSVCHKTFIPKFFKLFAKLQMPEDSWAAIDRATPDNFSVGRVEESYKSMSSLGKSSGESLPDSIFKTWLQNLASNYLEPEVVLKEPIKLAFTDEDIRDIRPIFERCGNILTLKSSEPQANGDVAKNGFVTVGCDKECYVVVVSEKPTPSALVKHSFLVVRPNPVASSSPIQVYEVTEQLKLNEVKIDQVKDLRKALSRLPKKPAESIGPRNLKKLNEILTKYRNREQIKARAQIFFNLAVLLDQLTDLDQFCQKLSDCIRELGEIYMKNPHHCGFVFDSLTRLGRDMNDRVGTLLHDFEKIEDNHDIASDLLLDGHSDLGAHWQALLAEIQRRVTQYIDNITNRHHIHNAQIGDPKAKGTIDYDFYQESQMKKEIQGMLAHAATVSMKYKMDMRKYDYGPVKQAIEARLTPSSRSRRALLPGLRRISPPPSPPPALHLRRWNMVGDGELKELKEEKELGGRKERRLLGEGFRRLDGHEEKHPDPLQQQLAFRVVRSRRNSVVSPQPEEDEPGDNPESYLQLIRARLKAIYERDCPNEKTRAAYERVYQALNGMHLKAQKLDTERDPPARKTKAADLKKLTVDLCEKTLHFFNLGIDKRKETAVSFADDIKDHLLMKRNRFLDAHVSSLYHFLRALKELVQCFIIYGFYNAYQRGGFFRTTSRVATYELEQSTVALADQMVGPPVPTSPTPMKERKH